MKFSRMRLSTMSVTHLSKLRFRTGITPNIMCRFALCLSLKDKSVPNPEEFNKKGSEISAQVLFGEHESIYLALMLSRLKQDRLDPELYLNEMTRAHVNRGVLALSPRIAHLSDFYELVTEEHIV